MKILLVEDDPATRSVLAETLISQNYSVDVATDGYTALERASSCAYDLITLDIVIPHLDGISLCKRLRAEGCHSPILLVTAKDSSSDRVIGLDAGADDYIIKPYDPSELLARIRALLRRSKADDEATITWGKIELNRVNNLVICNSKQVHLTPKEYCLLELFLSNPNRVFNRRAILDRLWDFAESPGEETISTHIKCLRQKLKAAGSTDPIETVHGLGYRLRQPLLTEGSLTTETVTPPVGHKALTIAASVWDQFKENYLEKINLLVQSAHGLEAGQYSSELHKTMQHAAHKLAGGLGIFGFTTGSHLAKELEQMLECSSHLTSDEVRRIVAQTDRLKHVLAPPQQTVLTEAAVAPLVLMIDDDLALAERLRAEAIASASNSKTTQTLRIETATDLATARQKIAQLVPDGIVLDLNFPGAEEDGLTLLQELVEHRPKIPVVVFTGRETLADRVAVARLGGCAFLQKPMPPNQILAAVVEALNQHPHGQNSILVVDDDPAVLAQLAQWFNPLGVRVTTLDDAAQFWQVLTSTQPNLLVLDSEMATFSGIELCQVVRNAPQWRNLPIVFLSAHTDEQTIAQAFAAGADDYVDKSTPESELVHRILRRLPTINLDQSVAQPRPSHSPQQSSNL